MTEPLELKPPWRLEQAAPWWCPCGLKFGHTPSQSPQRHETRSSVSALSKRLNFLPVDRDGVSEPKGHGQHQISLQLQIQKFMFPSSLCLCLKLIYILNLSPSSSCLLLTWRDGLLAKLPLDTCYICSSLYLSFFPSPPLTLPVLSKFFQATLFFLPQM